MRCMRQSITFLNEKLTLQYWCFQSFLVFQHLLAIPVNIRILRHSKLQYYNYTFYLISVLLIITNGSIKTSMFKFGAA